jgi:RNA polymerase sigma-70 factor, ECF subfamily
MQGDERSMPPGLAADPTTAFVREHFAFVWRVLRRLGLTREDADDVAQRVMLVATQRRSELLPGRERAFLYRTAAFMANRERRDRMRRRETTELELDEQAHGGEDPEALLAQRRAREWLDDVLSGMPLDLRAAFVLFEIEGMTKEEVAQALDIPSGTAASRLRRAREEFARRARQLAFTRGSKGVTA